MRIIKTNELRMVYGAFSESHFYNSSHIMLKEGECYISNVLSANLCRNGIYDLDGNLIQALKPIIYVINEFKIEINVSNFFTSYLISPNIYDAN